MRLFFLILTFLCLGKINKSQAQIPIGAWRTHFSYSQVYKIAITESSIYAAAGNGLFFFNKTDNSLQVLSKNEGLHDTGVSGLGYNQKSGFLVIGYRNGNIDVIKDRKIYNLPAIREAGINISKKINHISFYEETTFLATDFGIVTLLHSDQNNTPLSIGESYMNLGSTGNELAVKESASFRDSLFLATPEGVIAASLAENVNRMDYANWRRFDLQEGIPREFITAITKWNDQLYAAINGKGIYQYDGNTWELKYLQGNEQFTSLQPGNDNLLVASGDSLFQVTPGGKIVKMTGTGTSQPTSFKVDNEGNYWIGDRQNGLISNFNGSFSPLIPNGPATDNTSGLFEFNNAILGFPPGYNENFTSTNDAHGFYVFKNGTWQVFNRETITGTNIPSHALDNISGAAFTNQTKKTFLATYHHGILVMDGLNNLEWIPAKTILQNLDLGSEQDTTLRITGITIDQNNNTLWLTNYNSNYPLISRDLTSGEWKKYSFEQIVARFPVNILTNNGNLWINLASQGAEQLMVFNPETNQIKYLSAARDSGNLPGSFVSSLAFDRNNQLWTGTDEGVTVFATPFTIFNNQDINATRPLIDNQYLLNDELVTAIEVDGGNRKWIGTQNGIWLFNSAGDELIHHFTIKNSPLPSNQIQAINILPETGEVFIATNKGMVSYRSNATEPAPSHQQVKIFPNPVTKDYTGTVGIEGLPENVDIRITTISGNIVKKLPANGGTASWDVNNYQGHRVGTGIYLVFSSTGNGENTFIGKIAVIN